MIKLSESKKREDEEENYVIVFVILAKTGTSKFAEWKWTYDSEDYRNDVYDKLEKRFINDIDCL